MLFIPSPPPSTKNFKGAVQALEDVQTFLQICVCLDAAHTTSLLLNDVASTYTYVSSLKQSTLDHFITPWCILYIINFDVVKVYKMTV